MILRGNVNFATSMMRKTDITLPNNNQRGLYDPFFYVLILIIFW